MVHSSTVQKLAVISALLLVLPTLLLARSQPAISDSKLPLVSGVEAQPLLASAVRIGQALDFLGEPMPASAQKLLKEAQSAQDDARAVKMVQDALDPLCVAAVRIRKGDNPQVYINGAHPQLVEQGWRIALVKVINEPGVTT